MDFEGQNRKSHLDSTIQQAQPQGIDFYNNFLYYVDAAYEHVMQGKVDASGTTTFSIFKKDIKDLVNIKIFKNRPGASKFFSFSNFYFQFILLFILFYYLYYLYYFYSNLGAKLFITVLSDFFNPKKSGTNGFIQPAKSLIPKILSNCKISDTNGFILY